MSNNKSEIKYQQFDNICRFCLKSDFLLKPIFQEGSENVGAIAEVDEWDEYADSNYEYINISEYVRRLTDLQIEENDPYPKFLCLTCLDVIRTVKQFRNKVIASFEILQDAKNKYRTRKDSGAEDDLDAVEDYGLDISDQKYMEGFPEDEFDQPESDLFTDPGIRFDGLKTNDVKLQEATQQTKKLEQITIELDKTHITTEQDADLICPDVWRAATVWSKFIINVDSIVYDDYTEYTIFVDGGLTNSEKEFSCKIRLIHSDWKKSICENCNPTAQPTSMCEHIVALVLNLGLVVVPDRLVPTGWH